MFFKKKKKIEESELEFKMHMIAKMDTLIMHNETLYQALKQMQYDIDDLKAKILGGNN
jgi:hypothetical protein